jgi:hypothetical protein
MIRIISALLLSLVTSAALAQESKPLELADNAPESHVVTPGDTLWGISGKFLKSPWRWPELWRMNQEQVKNPHRIYPGQVLVLDRSGATPRLRLARPVKLEPKVYVEKDHTVIPSIPQNVIEPFLSRPLVVDEPGMKDAPRIVATQEDRVVLGPGNVAYVVNLDGKRDLWQIYRPAKPLVDPETKETLGYEAYYLGTARKVRDGEPATVEIVSAKEEIAQGDRLAPAARAEIVSYVPHAPNARVDGRIVAVYGGVMEAGRNAIVTLNRGTRDGLEVGHVLALYRRGAETTYRDDGDGKKTVKLPDERYGLVFVFRTFERVSYALVMDVTRPVAVADIVRAP